jgi:hypothetical protein
MRWLLFDPPPDFGVRTSYLPPPPRQKPRFRNPLPLPMRACTSAGGFLDRELRWRALPADPDSPASFTARSRHLALLLPGIQGSRSSLPSPSPPPLAALPPPGWGAAAAGGLPAPTGAAAAGGPGVAEPAWGWAEVPALSSVLVVFGGVGGDSRWFNDLSVLELGHTGGWDSREPERSCQLTHSLSSPLSPLSHSPTLSLAAAGETLTSWHTVEATQLLSDSSPNPGPSGRQAQSPLAPPPPPHLRDFAGCPVGPHQFLVHGGFDGASETAATYLYSVYRLDASSSATHAETATLHAATAAPALASPQRASFSATWQLVEPRNRPPPPRSHHSCAFSRPLNSVVVFGGYASGRGLLNEVWAFSLDHLEWFQPETSGEETRKREREMLDRALHHAHHQLMARLPCLFCTSPDVPTRLPTHNLITATSLRASRRPSKGPEGPHRRPRGRRHPAAGARRLRRLRPAGRPLAARPHKLEVGAAQGKGR